MLKNKNSLPQEQDFEDEEEFVVKDTGVNEESVSFEDPEIQALEQEAHERTIAMFDSAKLYNVTSVLKVS